MKQGSHIKKIIYLAVFCSLFLAGAAVRSEAAAMADYCVTPPFIVGGVKPNLLFMLDNSASMYDLSYIDSGSATRTPSYCYDQTFKSTNPYTGYFDPEKIYSNNLDANPNNNYFSEDASGIIPASCNHRIAGHLCIDKTASGSTFTLTKFMASGKYLNWLTTSKFDVQKKILTGGKFNTATNMLMPEMRGCVGRKFIKEALTADYVEGGTNTSLGITFAVKGPPNENNATAPSPGGQTYLSLYFGDYNAGLCQAAINAYSDPTSSNAAIKKAVDDCLSYTTQAAHCQLDIGRTCSSNSDCDNTDGVCANIALPTCSGSPKRCVGGGKAGQACNNANDCKFSTCSAGKVGTVCGRQGSGWDNSVCNTSVGPCITGTASTASKTGVVFNQTIQACWALKNGTPIGIDETNTVKNQCSDIYDELYTCNGGVNSGKTCTVATQVADCGAAINCERGPAAVQPGNPSYLCSNIYTGMCATTADNWVTTNWTGSYNDGTTIWTGNDCIKKLHEKFCGDITVPPVVDPTDAPSDTSVFDNLPAIINDIGIEAQLNQPFATLTVKNAISAAPSGLLQDFSGIIRMGAMSFVFDGSQSECGQKVCSNSFTTTCTTTADCTGTGACITPVPCPKVCSTSPVGEKVTCSTNLDCPNPASATCNATVAGTSNLDGGKVLTYITNSAGDHSIGLINDIDELKAKSWTPFSEGFYNAIGYFARTNPYTDAVGTSRTDLRINTNDFDANMNPSQYKCQENNILLISDGQPTAEKQSDVTSLAVRYNNGDTQTGFTATCPPYQGTMNLDNLAWLAKNRNIKTFSTSSTSTAVPATASEQITTFVVYTGPDTTGTTPAQCNPKELMNQTAIKGGTSLYNPQDPTQLTTSLRDALNKIAAKTASGTAASVLASGEGSGANLIQALFYPKRKIGTTDISWTGVLQNMWYYLDPNLGLSSIREDTDQDQALKLNSDYIIDFEFSSVTNETTANLYADANGDGSADSVTPTTSGVAMDSIKYLWEGGRKLFVRAAGSLNSESGVRQIFTNTNDDTTLDAFDTGNVANISPFLNTADSTPLIKYVRGIDDVDGNGSLTNADTIDGSPVRRRTITLNISGTPTTAVWKLSDIVNSTPKLVSWIPLNLYDKAYNDWTYRDFVNTSTYKNRNAVFAGANDGMLHAFKLGKLGIYKDYNIKATLGKVCSTTVTQACLANSDCPGAETCITETDIGKELWGFIPKHALPYLKYLADSTYCHLYSIDATPYIFDASIAIDTDLDDNGAADQSLAACNVSTYANYERCTKGKDSWRTVLIGSMRLGGACRTTASACTECNKTPIADVGYSSYFALDVTDPVSPSLMWEYANPELGLSTTGPAIVRINRKQCSATTATICTADTDCPSGEYCSATNNTNGKWFVVLGSGPAGYISVPTHQFTGVTPYYDSAHANFLNNPPKLIVLDLKTGSYQTTITPSSTFSSGFFGNLTNSTIDFNNDYSDDALYFGYTKVDRTAIIDTNGVPTVVSNKEIVFNAANAGLSLTDDAYKGKFLELIDASGNYIIRMITSYNGATKTAMLDTDLPTLSISATDYIIPGWTSGGVMRLVTKDSLSPSNWAISPVITGIGPVTAGVSKLQNLKNKDLRLFFGTGRFFYKIGDIIDDPDSQRKLFGIDEPCFPKTGVSPANIDTACTTTVLYADLGDASTTETGSADTDGWYINLDLCTNSSGTIVSCSAATAVFRTERDVTDPIAAPNGAVFFTTSSPAADTCEYGGASHIWAVRYDTGGSLAGTGILRGKALVQVSTGAIEEVDLATAFTERLNRRTGSIQGLPPAGGLSLVIPPAPIKKILHMRKQ